MRFGSMIKALRCANNALIAPGDQRLVSRQYDSAWVMRHNYVWATFVISIELARDYGKYAVKGTR